MSIRRIPPFGRWFMPDLVMLVLGTGMFACFLCYIAICDRL